ncbi:MAG: hypothetical protein IKQ46_18815 [Bacteroidales bacterium]|nr:hypothetical protein [Bacteroidales bacterium]
MKKILFTLIIPFLMMLSCTQKVYVPEEAPHYSECLLAALQNLHQGWDSHISFSKNPPWKHISWKDAVLDSVGKSYCRDTIVETYYITISFTYTQNTPEQYNKFDDEIQIPVQRYSEDLHFFKNLEWTHKINEYNKNYPNPKY